LLVVVVQVEEDQVEVVQEDIVHQVMDQHLYKEQHKH